jgi:hypothetical protein
MRGLKPAPTSGINPASVLGRTTSLATETAWKRYRICARRFVVPKGMGFLSADVRAQGRG